ncbi:maleylpyruvate isomerase N-terminal domain-containing protein [Actinoallomurus soli]|uniref:maleylpyruvate isomerase N-terminal domain-containing protein n=1 Tax=Actinoallomurus soli TaxID=2952535 RepID=UPI00209288CE|nr:maleylpyruvate isomerase N-terminal domain-containing protein [Actinoallomurus soli]MCO5973898.1 maleylpyruvate isomerase N-terminal domain-containing protein [Actinoallomurus soli]
MNRDRVMEAFRAESARLGEVALSWTDRDWALPTRCEPWRVRDLFGHVRVALAWLPGMLAGASPDQAEVSARQYYRPDERFSAATNDTRIALAQGHAADFPDGRALAEDFIATWQNVHRLCSAEPAGRVVRTRHGDAMLLSEFLVTRVVEVAVHGLDLAAARGDTPWLTPEAGSVVEELLTGRSEGADRQRLGWDQATFLEKATGRQPLTPAEDRRLADMNLQWLALG